MSEVQSILARIPFLANAADLRITELSGGITNRNYKIETSQAAYVLRIGGSDTGLLGIDRRVEYGCTLAASRVGVAPEPVAFLEPEGYLLTRFVAGSPIPAEAIGTQANIRRVVACLKRYHGLDRFPGVFSPFRVVESYLPTARQHHAPLPANMAWFLTLARQIEEAFLREPVAPVPCHNDLLNANFIDLGQTVCILDWEYAGMGDRFFDLGNFSAQHGFSAAQDEILLAEYFDAGDPGPSPEPVRGGAGRFHQSRFARLQLMKLMSDMREAMWAMVQCNLSQLDFDYVGYGMKYFHRIEVAAEEEQFREWLEAI